MSVTSGWGRFSWSQANWNADVTLKTGWGAKSWDEDEWGELKDAVAQPSGLSITSNVGSITPADQTQGLTGQSITPSVGSIIPCLLYTSPSPRDRQKSRMPSSA